MSDEIVLLKHDIGLMVRPIATDFIVPQGIVIANYVVNGISIEAIQTKIITSHNYLIFIDML